MKFKEAYYCCCCSRDNLLLVSKLLLACGQVSVTLMLLLCLIGQRLFS
jgi:hypothetical protein